MDAHILQDDWLRIYLLGGFHLCQGDETIGPERFRLRKARDMVKLLALTPDHRMHHEQLMELFWPDNDLDAAANSLHQTLHSARQVTESLHPPCHLYFENEWICLRSERKLWVDVEAFELAAQASGQTKDTAASLEAIRLYTGDLLPEDRYADLFSQPREVLRQTYLTLLKDLANIYEIRSDYPRKIEVLKKLVAEDASDEQAHTGLMRAYALSGERSLALRQYQCLQEALLQELDARPCEESRHLYEAILQGELAPSTRLEIPVPAVPTVLPPSHPLPDFAETAHPVHNLPHPLTSFIGRENEIAQVQALVLNTRLVVLTGAGGVGKTRLALRCAETLLENFPDGVWLVEFAALVDSNLLPQAVASVVGPLEDSGKNVMKSLSDFLRPKHLLLIFDNCEHVVSAAANLAEAILHTCPAVHILATSREILGASGETPFRCPSLSLPQAATRSGGTSLLVSAGELSRSEAVRLFMDRAWSASPGFALSEANAAAILQICQRLDGIPLAIELAAARVRVLKVDQVAARLDDAFHLLTGGSRTVLPRHQTLKALIDWSYYLLSPPEQVLLARLSAFSGGWTLEAAEAVCSDTQDGGVSAASAVEQSCADRSGAGGQGSVCLSAQGMLDLLGQLMDKSLIVPITNRESSTDREMRYRMLEPIRQYARDRLIEIEELRIEALCRRHLNYFARLVEQAEPHLRGESQIIWLDRLESEHDNLRAALEWALQNDVEGGLRLAAPLLWFSHIRHHRAEHTGWLERLLVADTDAPHPLPLDDIRARSYHKARAKALQTIGFYLLLQGKKDRSISVLEESIHIFRILGPGQRRNLAISLFFLSKQVETQKLVLLQESLEFFRSAGEAFYTAECLQNLGSYYDGRGETQQARSCWEEDLALYRQIHDLDGEGMVLKFLADQEFHGGHFEQARQLYEQSSGCYERIGNREFVCFNLFNLASLAIAQGDHQEMARCLERAHMLARAMEDQAVLVIVACMRGWLEWYLGNYEQAVAHCEEARFLCREVHSLIGEESVLYVLGRVSLTRGEYPEAKTYIKELLTSAQENKDIWAISEAFDALALLAARQGRAEIAMHLVGAQHALVPWLTTTQSPKERQEQEQSLTAARAALGEDAFTAALEQGQAMTLDEAVELGLAV